MKLIRYYHKRPIESAHIGAIRDLLTQTFSWGLASASYHLYYASEVYQLAKMADVGDVVEKMGQPAEVVVRFVSQQGRTLKLDSLDQGRITVEADNGNNSPSKLLDAIESRLALERIGEKCRDVLISSAFITHAFDDEGTAYANELARFLGYLGIECQSGRGFAPGSIAEKVSSRLAKHDMFVAILTPQEDNTWVTQEIATAKALDKHIFIMKEAGVRLKPGILGDHEYIQFPRGQLSKAFIPVLEGLAEIIGRPASFYR